MCGRTGMSWRRRSTPGSRTGSRGGDDRVCLRRGEGLRSFQGGRETWKTASWQPAGSRIRLPLKESDIPVAVNPKSADGPSNNPQCGFWDSQFSAAQVKSVEQPCTADEAMWQFTKAMESKWMGLATSTALAERVDLFLQTREFRCRLSSSDLCLDCNGRMLLKAIHSTLELCSSHLQIRRCGSAHTRHSRAVDFPR